jgi:hypothetical protein
MLRIVKGRSLLLVHNAATTLTQGALELLFACLKKRSVIYSQVQ